MVPEGCFKCGQVEGGCWWRWKLSYLHDGTGVRSVTGQDRRGTIRALVRGTGVVIVARYAGREGCWGIVVQDQGLASELREVDDHVGALSRCQQQGMQVHVTDVKAGRVGDPGGRLAGRLRPLERARSHLHCRSAIQSGPASLSSGLCRRHSQGVGETTGSSWAAATSAGFKATSLRVPVVGQRCTTASSRSGRWLR